jgi:hypothetical protein
MNGGLNLSLPYMAAAFSLFGMPTPAAVSSAPSSQETPGPSTSDGRTRATALATWLTSSKHLTPILSAFQVCYWSRALALLLQCIF